MKNEIKNKEELIKKTENIAKKIIKYFVKDYQYDKQEFEKEKGIYCWCVRKSGTHLINLQDENSKSKIEYLKKFYSTQCPSQNAKFYYINLSKYKIEKWEK